jgi:hypothetical protein
MSLDLGEKEERQGRHRSFKSAPCGELKKRSQSKGRVVQI